MPRHPHPSDHHTHRSLVAYLIPAIVTICFASAVALPLLVKGRIAKGKGTKEMDPITKWWMQVMTEYRGVFMVLVVLPLSFLLETYMEARDWVFRNFLVTPKLHDARVKRVQVTVGGPHTH